MKYFVLTLFCVAIARAASTYNDRYDKIDLDSILTNQRLLKNYVYCLLEKGKCRPEGVELKGILPDALQTKCSKCTEAQKTGTRKVIVHLIKNHRDWWNELEAKYDPKKIYVMEYKDELKKLGITL
ncbi:hypothetical protein HHI36_003079 [Cryptolaemus montrouzieri]|uniref:Chemosensory protein n=1 Tax=Cryptolaemus montrouzieri TaxID=559131 RepID=A0ABD2PCE6_9CUCU